MTRKMGKTQIEVIWYFHILPAGNVSRKVWWETSPYPVPYTPCGYQVVVGRPHPVIKSKIRESVNLTKDKIWIKLSKSLNWMNINKGHSNTCSGGEIRVGWTSSAGLTLQKMKSTNISIVYNIFTLTFH